MIQDADAFIKDDYMPIFFHADSFHELNKAFLDEHRVEDGP